MLSLRSIENCSQEYYVNEKLLHMKFFTNKTLEPESNVDYELIEKKVSNVKRKSVLTITKVKK